MRRSGIILIACVIGLGLIAFAAVQISRGWIAQATTKDTSCLAQGVVGAKASCEILVHNAGFATLTLGPAKVPHGLTIEGAGSDIGWTREKAIRAVVDTDVITGRGTIPVSIRTNDPKRPELKLSVKFDIRAFVVAQPGYARYIYVQKAKEGTIVQTIGTTDGAPFHILKVESPLPQLRVAWREAAESERLPKMSGVQWLVESTLLENAPVGALSGDLVVRTDHPKQPILRIPVNGFVRPIFAVTPPVVSIAALDPKMTPEMRLHVKNFAEEPIKVTGASTTVRGISATVTTTEAGRVYYVVLKFGSDLPAGPFKGTVHIHTASPKIPVIDVPLDGTRSGS